MQPATHYFLIFTTKILRNELFYVPLYKNLLLIRIILSNGAFLLIVSFVELYQLHHGAMIFIQLPLYKMLLSKMICSK